MTGGIAALAAASLLGGCAGAGGARPYSPQAESDRDGLKAQRLTQEAARLITTDPGRAESLLREALTADLYYGPAHNNLGVLYLKQSPPKLYEASSEFEWSRKLMPGHPDPRMNLALTLEKAGRFDEAIATYRTALEVFPGHVPTLEALARLQLRSGKAGADTAEMLSTVALQGETDAWRRWAQLQHARLAPRTGAAH